MLRYRYPEHLDSSCEERPQARWSQFTAGPRFPLLARFALGVGEDMAEDVASALWLAHFRHADHHRTSIPRLSQLNDKSKSTRQYASGECRVRATSVHGRQTLQPEECLLWGFGYHGEQDTVGGKQKLQQRYGLLALHLIDDQTNGVHSGHQREKIASGDGSPPVFRHGLGSERSDPRSLERRLLGVLDGEDLPVSGHVGNKTVEKFSGCAPWRPADSEVQSGPQAYREELECLDRQNATSYQIISIERTRVRRLAFATTTPVRDHARL